MGGKTSLKMSSTLDLKMSILCILGDQIMLYEYLAIINSCARLCLFIVGRDEKNREERCLLVCFLQSRSNWAGCRIQSIQLRYKSPRWLHAGNMNMNSLSSSFFLSCWHAPNYVSLLREKSSFIIFKMSKWCNSDQHSHMFTSVSFCILSLQSQPIHSQE
jgi:hypothetical protein